MKNDPTHKCNTINLKKLILKMDGLICPGCRKVVYTFGQKQFNLELKRRFTLNTHRDDL